MYILIPIINLIGLEIVYLYFPKLIYGVSGIVAFLTIFFIFKYSKEVPKMRIALIISAILFLISHYVLIIFLEGALLVHSFIALTSFVLFLFFLSLYDKQFQTVQSTHYALENIIGYFNLIIYYFLTVDVYFFQLNTNQQFLTVVILYVLYTLCITFSSLYIYHVFSRLGKLYFCVLIFVMVQIFWSISFLPISVYSKAAVVTLNYYIFLGLSRHYLIFGSQEMTRKIIVRYILITLTGMALVFLTAKW